MRRELHLNHRMNGWDLQDHLLPILSFSMEPKHQNPYTITADLGCSRMLIAKRILSFRCIKSAPVLKKPHPGMAGTNNRKPLEKTPSAS